MIPTVLIHAFPLSSRMYGPLGAGLGDIGLVLPDLPGFGGTSLSKSEPSVDAYATQVADELQQQGVNEVVIGGTSMGGYVAMAFCRLFPERVAGVALIDTKATADIEAAAAGRRAMADRLESENSSAALVEAVLPKLLGATSFERRSDVVELVSEWVKQCDPRAAAWAQRAMAARPDSMETLRSLSVPALVVVGEEDVLTPPSDATAMASELVDCRLVVIPDAGHLTPVEEPDAVAVALTHLAVAVEG